MKITKLEPSKRKQGRFLVHLENGDILRVGEGEVVAFALGTGVTLDDDRFAALTQAAAHTTLQSKAISTLSVRPMSRKELLGKLSAWGATDQQGEAVADRMEELGLLNDREYARLVVEHYAAKAYGPYKIKDELYRRGVPREYWDEALAQLDETGQGIDLFLRKKLGGVTPDRKALKRASDALARRGYRWEDINAALRRYGADVCDD